MIPQANITAWREFAPWPDDAQIEQDLVLSRATVELFNDKTLAGKIALRGGTALQKLLIKPPFRYSEDIDLVQTEACAIKPMWKAIRGNLDKWLGTPTRKVGPKTATLIYRFESEIAPVRTLRLKIEINTREHFSLLALQEILLAGCPTVGVRTGAPFVENDKTGFVVDRLPPGRQCVSGDEDIAALAKLLQAIDQAQSQSRKTVRLCAMEIFDTRHVVENVIDVLANIRTSIASDAVAADHLQQGNGIPWTTN